MVIQKISFRTMPEFLRDLRHMKKKFWACFNSFFETHLTSVFSSSMKMSELNQYYSVNYSGVNFPPFAKIYTVHVQKTVIGSVRMLCSLQC